MVSNCPLNNFSRGLTPLFSLTQFQQHNCCKILLIKSFIASLDKSFLSLNNSFSFLETLWKTNGKLLIGDGQGCINMPKMSHFFQSTKLHFLARLL